MDTIVTPVTVITLDSTRIVHNIKADLVARYFPPVVRLVQYDQSLPVIAVSLMQNGQTYTLPSGAAANIRVHKPDATYVYNPALGCDSTRNIVYFEVTQAMAAASGDGLAIVEIVVNGDIAGTSLITLHFEENPVPEDAIESSDEWETIYELGERIIASTVTPVSTAAGMTDHNVVYLYTGTESGWNQGHMYYYNGTTWVDAGIAYTDKTLSVANLAADAKATGDAIEEVKDGLGDAEIVPATWESGYFNLSGSTVDSSTRTASSGYVSSRMECTDGDIFVITSTGAASARNWAFLSSESGTGNVLLKKYSPYTSDNEIAVAQPGSVYAIFNASVNAPYSVTKVNNKKQVLALSHAYLTDVNSGVDFNNYKTPGNYRVPTARIASGISNIPAALGGRLMVMSINSANAIMQMYVSTEGQAYVRRYTSNAWGAWGRVFIATDIPENVASLRHQYATIVSANSDLDDIRTAGNYVVSTTSSALTIANIPEAVSGRLTVMTLAGTGSVHQWFISSSNNWYIRELIGGNWSSWRRFVDEDAIGNNSEIASKGAYNALQAVIKNVPYDVAFANAFTPLSLDNYVGNSQNVHPKVLYFSGGFGGHKFWMAYTPYPYSKDLYENPCVAYSDDGYSWTNISANPLDDPRGNGYDSDTHLVYNSTSQKLECWYRWVAPASQSPRSEVIYRQTSSDGINWSAKEVVFDNDSGNYANLLSPAVIIENGKYRMWVVQSTQSPVTIDYYESPTSAFSWTKDRSINLTFTDDGTVVRPWHMDAIKDGSDYVLLVQCRNSQDVNTARCSLFVAKSSDNIAYSTPVKVVGGADNWDRFMYRSTIVKVESAYRIYYSAGSGGTETIYNNAVWGIGITESDSLTTGYKGRFE